MKKRTLLLLAIIMLLLGSTVTAYSYWDNLEQNTANDFEIGYGVRLEAPVEYQDSRALVPEGSFYAAYEEDYTTEYELTYVLNLEDDLQPGMQADLAIDITDFDVNDVAFTFNQESSLFTIAVGTDEVDASVESDGIWNFVDAFEYSDNSVTVTVTISLNDTDYDYSQAEYDALAGFVADFAIGFELSNSSSSTINPEV